MRIKTGKIRFIAHGQNSRKYRMSHKQWTHQRNYEFLSNLSQNVERDELNLNYSIFVK